MDLDKFKEQKLDEVVTPPTPENIPVENIEARTPIPENEQLERIDDFSESDKIIADLENKINEIKNNESVEVDEEVVLEDNEPKTFLEKFSPYILPILLTIFALLLAALLVYFFSNYRNQQPVEAITNTGNVEEIITPAEIVVVEEPIPLTCVEPQTISEDGTFCVDPPPPPVVEEPKPILFSDGTTTIVNVRFSYDRINYDNTPRGIFLREIQIFEGDYEGFKISASNRAFANDYFFGVDRYMVSLIGDCSYVIDDADILVENMRQGNKIFTGKVLKIIKSSKPRVSCDR